jgi:hypothetical protein
MTHSPGGADSCGGSAANSNASNADTTNGYAVKVKRSPTMTDMTPAEALAGQIIDRLDEDTRRKLETLLRADKA